jgi:hypothetical protein
MKNNKKTTSKVKNFGKGYTWDINRNKWMVRISANNKRYYLGRYENEVEARVVYLSALLYRTAIFGLEGC